MAVLFALLFIVLWRDYRIALRGQRPVWIPAGGGITSMILINALINAGWC